MVLLITGCLEDVSLSEENAARIRALKNNYCGTIAVHRRDWFRGLVNGQDENRIVIECANDHNVDKM